MLMLMQLLRHLCIHAELQDRSTSSSILLRGKDWALWASCNCRRYLALLNKCQWRQYIKPEMFLGYRRLQRMEFTCWTSDILVIKVLSSPPCFISLTWGTSTSVLNELHLCSAPYLLLTTRELLDCQAWVKLLQNVLAEQRNPALGMLPVYIVGFLGRACCCFWQLFEKKSYSGT